MEHTIKRSPPISSQRDPPQHLMSDIIPGLGKTIIETERPNFLLVREKLNMNKYLQPDVSTQ